MRPCFTAEDAARASEEWGANCGPTAIAAIIGMTLDEVRPHMGDFERKGYTNPTLMWETLNRLGRPWRKSKPEWPGYGLVRIQWEGPWTEPGANPRWAYRHTHWVGGWRTEQRGYGVFDINAIGNGTGWCALADWERVIVPWILREAVPRANGKWHITHAVEVEFEGAIRSAAH